MPQRPARSKMSRKCASLVQITCSAINVQITLTARWETVLQLRKQPPECAKCRFYAMRTHCQCLCPCKKWRLTSSPLNLWTKLLTKATHVGTRRELPWQSTKGRTIVRNRKQRQGILSSATASKHVRFKAPFLKLLAAARHQVLVGHCSARRV